MIGVASESHALKKQSTESVLSALCYGLPLLVNILLTNIWAQLLLHIPDILQ